MPIAPSLQRFVDDELARSDALIERTLAGTVQHLADAKELGLSSGERACRAQSLASLRRRAGPFMSRFVEALQVDVQSQLDFERRGPKASDAAAPDDLALMDESRVEVDILVSRAIETFAQEAEWELRELQTFTSTLRGQTHVSPQSNPLPPRAYAAALWLAVCEVSVAPVERATLLQAAAVTMAGLLKAVWAGACSRLEAQGIEPGIYRTVVLPGSGTAPNQPSAASTGLRSRLAGVPIGAGAAASSAAVAASASRLPAADDALQRQTVDIASRIFEAVLAGPHLEPRCRPIVATLQAPALRVAQSDPSVADSVSHAVWRMIDRIGDAGAACAQPHDPRDAALLALFRQLADGLAGAIAPDATLFERALERVDAFFVEQWRTQLNEVKATVDALARSERKNLLTERLSQRLADEVATLDIGDGVREFLVGRWSQVLTEAVLQFGESSEPVRTQLRVVDDLLWSLAPPDHPQSRQRLVVLLPGLLQRLRAGLATIGVPQPEQQAFLDALMAHHTDALRPGLRSHVNAPTAQQILQRLDDDDAESGPAVAAPAFDDSLIDLASMQTVPAALMRESQLGEAAASRRFDGLAPGKRCQLFLNGRWTRVLLLWRSPQGRFLLFAGEAPGRTHSLTRRALERLGEAGLVRSSAEPSLVQRAVDALTRPSR